MQFVRRFLRFTIYCLLAGYILSACVMIGVKYFVLPNIDRWRPDIERQLSVSLNAKVLIGEISAGWAGLQPSLTIRDFRILDKSNKPLMTLPGLYAVASWASLPLGELRFSRLEIDSLKLSGLKHPDGTVTFIDLEMDPLDTDQLSTPADITPIGWLLSQGHIVLRHASLNWTDLTRGTDVLELTDIDLTLNNGIFHHEMKITASPAPSLGSKLELLMRADHAFDQRFSSDLGRKIEFYAQLDHISPKAWRPWFDLPELSGLYSGRAWVEFQKGHLTHSTIDIKAWNASGQLAEQSWRASEINLRIQGWLADILPDWHAELLAPSLDRKGIDIAMDALGFEVEGAFFDPSLLIVGGVNIKAKVARTPTGQIQVSFSNLAAQNEYLDLSLAGTWTEGGLTGVGIADITGSIKKLNAPALYKILPTTLSPEPRAWLKQSLLTGKFFNASLRLKGDLAFYPFNACGNHGIFIIDGQFSGLTLDYSPPIAQQLGWPAANALNGALKIDGLGLEMKVASGEIRAQQAPPVILSGLLATIPDMHFDPQLDLQVQTNGAAQSYLNALLNTPIAERMGEGYDAIRMSGELDVPFRLKMSLADPAHIGVDGSISVQQSTLSLSQELPDISELNGKIQFSDETVRFNDLHARLLDGKIKIDGAFDQADGYIQVDGVLGAAWLTQAGKLPSKELLKGSFEYTGKLKLNASGGIDAQFSTNLHGLSIDLPAPLGKPAENSVLLKLKYTGSRKNLDQRKSVIFDYGGKVKGQFERTLFKATQSYFNRAMISIGTEAKVPLDGLLVDAVIDRFEWDIWADSFHAFLGGLDKDSNPRTSSLPPLVSARLRTPQLVWSDVSLSDIDLSLNHNAQNIWRANLKSKETDGTIDWRKASGSVPGEVTARFTRLVMGSTAEAIKTDVNADTSVAPDTPDNSSSDWSDIPAIDLTIDDLTLYGNKLGALHFKGSNLERGKRWKIEQLSLQNDFASLLADGSLRLVEPNRGLSLNGELVIKDLGDLSAFMGYPDRVRDGSGSLGAKIEWKNFPWVFDYGTLSGSAQIDLKNGVFEHQTSRSARLLELLSIQSLQRLFSLNFKSATVFENGFPWNKITGKFAITKGIVSTDDLTVSAPVAEILLTGKSDLSKKIWDMQADVKPIFDMSGTAVATGFVVNPLVGLGALIGQFILRNPIEKALTARYTVTGPWDDPKLEPLSFQGLGSTPAGQADTKKPVETGTATPP